MTIGNRIKEQRKILKLTQPQLAEKINMSIDSIKKMETDKMTPSVETLSKLADLFGCSADYLMGRSRYKNRRDEENYASWFAIHEMLDAATKVIFSLEGSRTNEIIKKMINELPPRDCERKPTHDEKDHVDNILVLILKNFRDFKKLIAYTEDILKESEKRKDT